MEEFAEVGQGRFLTQKLSLLFVFFFNIYNNK